MHETILVTTDLSSGVDNAVEYAIDSAAASDATLHVLYVVDAEAYSSYPGDEYVHEFEGLEHALEQAGREAVESIAERAADAGVETETVLRRGVPHEEILAYTDEADVDLTVVGSKARSGEYRRLLGSVAQRVTSMAERPVTIVKTPVQD
ncbi:UspA domain protein [Halovivax asiaticus JCM 14624]|uniref:UspA domain protein n=1 Tax=Halovivax asiaticus JCM 14624 TaxID=1227490 RepID=M0BIR6_9EURY|nr:universal stress protein [Halovivax asiaticus]ELZ10755.1 UspA domain protein [Halovivax asiaticus JCM 14624]